MKPETLARRLALALLAALGVAVLLVIGFVAFFLGPAVKAAAERMGPAIIGTPVTVENVSIRPLAGLIHISTVAVANPPGYQMPNAIELGSLDIDISMRTLFSETILIRSVRLLAPVINYETDLHKSNLSVLSDHAKASSSGSAGTKPGPEGQPPAAPAPGTPAKKPAAAKSNRKVKIEKVVIEKGRVNLSTTLLKGNALALEIPDMTLTDIGESQAGGSMEETTSAIFREIIRRVTAVVKGTGGTTGAAGGDPATIAIKSVSLSLKKAGGSAAAAGEALDQKSAKLARKLDKLLFGSARTNAP